MFYLVFIPLAVGAMGVLQNTLNRKVGEAMGLPLALVVNNLVLLALSIALFLCLKLVPQDQLSPLWRSRGSVELFVWRNFWPGLFGFLIIAALPQAIERVGAMKVFLGVIVAQLAVSILWDLFLESIPLSLPRLLGAFLALVGAVIATRG